MPKKIKSDHGRRFAALDRVRVIDRNSASHDQIGSVSSVAKSAIYRGRSFCRVDLGGVQFGFSCEQLEKVTLPGVRV